MLLALETKVKDDTLALHSYVGTYYLTDPEKWCQEYLKAI